ncbi:MAG: hypothetical protein ACTSYA_09835 [Candidatus Kariarchaeaceae archaeon]
MGIYQEKESDMIIHFRPIKSIISYVLLMSFMAFFFIFSKATLQAVFLLIIFYGIYVSLCLSDKKKFLSIHGAEFLKTDRTYGSRRSGEGMFLEVRNYGDRFLILTTSAGFVLMMTSFMIVGIAISPFIVLINKNRSLAEFITKGKSNNYGYLLYLAAIASVILFALLLYFSMVIYVPFYLTLSYGGLMILESIWAITLIINTTSKT